ncbi:VanZ family protein [Carboxydothermus islandicus]|uniref:VanZ family protein n=1 Tax=Carboxydothermus islandicus TaxID=661089 RepID=A0A1L8D2S2_9THEO|nr:VanZ family protein [Carboxydothermus islandicus]
MVILSTVKQTDFSTLKIRLLHSNIIPFKTICYYVINWSKSGISRINIIANIAAFIPLGFLLLRLLDKGNKFKKIILISLILSLLFEIIQLITGIGNFDIDDVILNVIGSMVGVIVYNLFEKVKT